MYFIAGIDVQGGREMRRRGFTLIELIIVIVIVVIVGMIFSWIVGAARQKVWDAGCQNNMRQIVNAVRFYAADYDGFLPSDFERMSWAADDFFWDWKEYACPAYTAAYGKGRGYGYNRLIAKMTMKQLLSDQIPFIWDGTDITTLPDAESLAEHLDYKRHPVPVPERGLNLGFLDGRVERKTKGSVSSQVFSP